MQDTQHPTPAGGSTGRRRRRLLPLAVAAAVLAVAGAAYVATRDDRSAPPPTADEPTVTELVLPGTDSPGRCLQVDARTVAGVETAFEGTVTDVDDDRVVLDVVRWFVGGDADQVELSTPSPQGVVPRLPGLPVFEVGERWLVTATDGRANLCGFTAPRSDRLAAVFDEAFPG